MDFDITKHHSDTCCPVCAKGVCDFAGLNDAEDEKPSIEDWLEKEIMRKFPDNLKIPIGQLRVRVHILCRAYKDKLEKENDNL
jgi:hypothetical protein